MGSNQASREVTLIEQARQGDEMAWATLVTTIKKRYSGWRTCCWGMPTRPKIWRKRP